MYLLNRLGTAYYDINWRHTSTLKLYVIQFTLQYIQERRLEGKVHSDE